MSSASLDFIELGCADAAVRELLFAVLYRGFGVGVDDEWLHADAGGVLALARGAANEVVGVARLMPGPGEPSRQLRQVAVAPAAQRSGIGRQLVVAVEQRAGEEGAGELWLNARDTAFGFYEALGYRFDGPPFVSELTGISHRCMRKAL